MTNTEKIKLIKRLISSLTPEEKTIPIRLISEIVEEDEDENSFTSPLQTEGPLPYTPQPNTINPLWVPTWRGDEPYNPYKITCVIE